MRMIGSVVEEQGVKFAVVLVKKHVVDSQTEANNTIQSLSAYFPGLPVVLAAQDGKGVFTYYGKQDISRFLASIDPTRIPWSEYTA
jgi:hypothetical protein